MTSEEVANVLRYGTQLPQLHNIQGKLSNDIALLESREQELKSELRWIHRLVMKSKPALEYYNNQCESKQKELAKLISEINKQKMNVQNF